MPKPNPKLVLPSTVREEQALLALNQFQLLTAEQVTRLLYGKSLSHVRGRLVEFSHPGGLVVQAKISEPQIGQGNKPNYFYLSSKGYRYLHMRGLPVGPRSHHNRDTNPYPYITVNHTIIVNDVLISLITFCRKNPTYKIITLIHEHTWKSPKYYDRVQIRLPGNKMQTLPVVPDSFLDMQTPFGPTSFALEVDMATAHDTKKWRDKIRGYVAWHRSGRYQQRFGTDRFSLMVVAPKSAAEAEQLLNTTTAELDYLDAHEFQSNVLITSVHPGTVSPEAFLLDTHWATPGSSERVAFF